jgi:hypothetical protein
VGLSRDLMIRILANQIQEHALARGDVIGGPIRYSVPLLRDVMTAILARFEWHDDVRSQKRARLLYRPLLAANHRTVQQGPAAQQILIESAQPVRHGRQVTGTLPPASKLPRRGYFFRSHLSEKA